MKNLKLVVVLVATGIVATACCCPLELCLGGGGLPTGALPNSDTLLHRAPAQNAPVAAVAPAATQRF
ncbi:MAG: hypothetical protein A2138_23940 [Deltaproteobacteria bacterium RBG_16_71_12]|nr:MAG: hypothetical protein A2138_23940 [Deltaproteobacteria bacterium RBG_16_71_12]